MDQGIRPRLAVVVAAFALALTAAIAVAALVLIEERRWAGLAAGVAAASIALAARSERTRAAPRVTFLDSILERTVDAVILGSLAWGLLPGAPRAGVAALVALWAAYVTTYVRVKALGLGFPMRDPAFPGWVPSLAVAVGLLVGAVEVALWAAAVVALGAASAIALEVARAEEPA